MNLEPIDVRPRPLTDEPARDDGALSDARDAGHDEHADLGGGPRVERLLLVGPPEHASESAERVSPEDRRNRTRTDSMETREVEPPSADERYGGGEVHVGGENLRDLRDPHRCRVETLPPVPPRHTTDREGMPLKDNQNGTFVRSLFSNMIVFA